MFIEVVQAFTNKRHFCESVKKYLLNPFCLPDAIFIILSLSIPSTRKNSHQWMLGFKIGFLPKNFLTLNAKYILNRKYISQIIPNIQRLRLPFTAGILSKVVPHC